MVNIFFLQFDDFESRKLYTTYLFVLYDRFEENLLYSMKSEQQGMTLYSLATLTKKYLNMGILYAC